MKRNDTWTTWIDVGALVVALAAFGVSIKSCIQSTESNQVSLKALEQSKMAFVAENRPMLTIIPLHDKTMTNYFFGVESTSESNVVLNLLFQIENVGATPATEIKILPDSIIDLSGTGVVSGRLPLSFGASVPTSLAQGAKYGLCHRHDFQQLSGAANVLALIENFKNRSIKIEVELGISYAAPGITDQRFCTRVRYALSEQEARILKSEY